MAQVKVVAIPVGEEFYFNEKEYIIVQHWYEMGTVILLLGEPIEDDS